MLSFEQARERLLSDVIRVEAERVPLADAAGRVMAETLYAATPLPRYAFSAMDGYAVALNDFEQNGPWLLPLVGTSKAGQSAPPLKSGTTCRIFTGASIPPGADAVVMQEQVQTVGDAVRFEKRPARGAHIRQVGEDLAQGASAVGEGVRLHAGHVALASMLGQPDVRVARRPVVTILCTGDELRPAGAELQDAQIFESNSAALGVLAEQAGASVRVAPSVKDEPAALAAALTQALDGTDLLLTVGGVSVGDHDLVRPMLEQVGVRLDFWKVAIKPGKPLAVGRSERAVVLGLPGNPASALVTFALFGMPLLRAMQGDLVPVAPPLRARLSGAVDHSLGRLEFARSQLALIDGQWQATVHSNQSSGAATSLAWCNGLVALASEITHFEEGACVEAWRFSDF